jgi:hypothetical protein
MLCPACNREIPDTAVACTYCGHRWATEELPIPPPPGPPQGMPAPPAQMPQGPPAQSPYTPPAGPASPYYTPAPGYTPAPRSAATTQFTILLALVASGLVIGSAFMPWLTASGYGGSINGWDLFDGARQGGAAFNDWFFTTEGAWFFSGLFTVVTGALLAIQALIALVPPAGPRSPVAIAGFGIICFGGALVNIISMFGNSFFDAGGGFVVAVSPGAGLWVWAVAALVSPILLLASPGPRR